MTPLEQLRARVPKEIAEEASTHSEWEYFFLKGYIAALPRIEVLEKQLEIAGDCFGWIRSFTSNEKHARTMISQKVEYAIASINALDEKKDAT